MTTKEERFNEAYDRARDEVVVFTRFSYTKWKDVEYEVKASFIKKFDQMPPEEWFRKPAVPRSTIANNEKRFTDFYDEEATYPKELMENPKFFDQVEPFWRENPMRK